MKKMLQRIAQSFLEFSELSRELCIARRNICFDLGRNYGNLQDRSIKLFISMLATVIDSTNQILIPEAGIRDGRHQ